MNIVAKFLRRDPAEVEPWAETCGQIRPLIEEADGAAAEVHHVEIHDAKLHYHEKTDEVYYVIDGEGTMVLDGKEIELHRGTGGELVPTISGPDGLVQPQATERANRHLEYRPVNSPSARTWPLIERSKSCPVVSGPRPSSVSRAKRRKT